MENVIRLYKALADENRLRIMNLLRRGELCVCKITEILSMPQSRASRHLACLKNAGLVHDRREGLWIHYSLVDSSSPLHEKILETLDHLSDESPLFVQDVKALEKKGDAACIS
jgi:ArsR family transcriptional regulator